MTWLDGLAIGGAIFIVSFSLDYIFRLARKRHIRAVKQKQESKN